jgi:V/A-type H+/Na+-transporting ATPase subunit E
VEELQNLLDKIQRDGVEQAEAQAARIVGEAEERARAILAEAKASAEATVAQAERDAQVFVERAHVALEQGVRDYLLRVQHGIEELLREIMRGTVAEALTPSVVAEMLVKLSQAYGGASADDEHATVLLGQRDADEFVELFLSDFRQRIAQGVQIHIDERIRRGFRVSFNEDGPFHDFTVEAIAESLAEMLRPPLKEIVRRAASTAGP